MRPLPPALAELIARRRPLGAREVFLAWADVAALLGLSAGELGDVNLAAFTAGVPQPDGPYRRSEVEVILDALEGQARRRRGRYRLVTAPGRPPAIVPDASGAVDNLAAVLRDFTALAAEHLHRVIVAAGDDEGDERAARRHAVSARSIRRWRREGAGQNSPSVAAETAKNGRRLSA